MTSKNVLIGTYALMVASGLCGAFLENAVETAQHNNTTTFVTDFTKTADGTYKVGGCKSLPCSSKNAVSFKIDGWTPGFALIKSPS